MSSLRLRPPRNGPDPAARRWWSAQAFLLVTGPALLTAAGLLVPAALFFPATLPWLAPLTAGVTVVPALAYQAVMPGLRFRVHGWELGGSAVYSVTGWLWRRHRITPLSRVQTVDTAQGPIQRMFGLVTVTMTTASTASRVTVPGLTPGRADALADAIAAAADREDAT